MNLHRPTGLAHQCGIVNAVADLVAKETHPMTEAARERRLDSLPQQDIIQDDYKLLPKANTCVETPYNWNGLDFMHQFRDGNNLRVQRSYNMVNNIFHK
eukprot:141657-Amphidinium_carterae.1